MVLDDIVNVFDKNDVGVKLIEVFDQSAVSARTKSQFLIVIAKRTVVQTYRNRIGCFVLITKSCV